MNLRPLSIVTDRIAEVCHLTAPTWMLSDLRDRFKRSGLMSAVVRHDTPVLFDWLMPVLSFQGVSDAIAAAYMEQHGTVTFGDIETGLTASPRCPKLRSYWDFAECGFAKASFICDEPDNIDRCPLPLHDLRNGRLNQAAFSLFLFFRDVCGGDLVGWIDDRLAQADRGEGLSRSIEMRASLLDPLRCIFGISSKVLAMALADLLLAGDPARERWVVTGASMIAVDTLVHNWLHRSGCLQNLQVEHAYGPGCYASGRCADIIEVASQGIDARRFCPEGPAVFPRLIQKAIWLFCTQDAFDICNGNRIDDRNRCDQPLCPIFDGCARVSLRPKLAKTLRA